MSLHGPGAPSSELGRTGVGWWRFQAVAGAVPAPSLAHLPNPCSVTTCSPQAAPRVPPRSSAVCCSSSSAAPSQSLPSQPCLGRLPARGWSPRPCSSSSPRAQRTEPEPLPFFPSSAPSLSQPLPPPPLPSCPPLPAPASPELPRALAMPAAGKAGSPRGLGSAPDTGLSSAPALQPPRSWASQRSPFPFPPRSPEAPPVSVYPGWTRSGPPSSPSRSWRSLGWRRIPGGKFPAISTPLHPSLNAAIQLIPCTTRLPNKQQRAGESPARIKAPGQGVRQCLLFSFQHPIPSWNPAQAVAPGPVLLNPSLQRCKRSQLWARGGFLPAQSHRCHL